MNTVRRWVLVGIAELFLSLILFALAPRFLNSDKPAIGFLMWAAVPALLGGSGLYVAGRLITAHQTRQRFLSRFPKYCHLGLDQFLDLSDAQVAEVMELLEATRNDPDFQTLHFSPLDWLRGLTRK